MRHGPHHSAQKSTRILPGVLMTSASKSSCETASTYPLLGSRLSGRRGGAAAGRGRGAGRRAVECVEIALRLHGGQRAFSDRHGDLLQRVGVRIAAGEHARELRAQAPVGDDVALIVDCLLYTSDAADEEDS